MDPTKEINQLKANDDKIKRAEAKIESARAKIESAKAKIKSAEAKIKRVDARIESAEAEAVAAFLEIFAPGMADKIADGHNKAVRIRKEVRRIVKSDEKLASFHLEEINNYEFKISLLSCPKLFISVLCLVSSDDVYAELMVRLPGDKYVGRKYFNLSDDGYQEYSDEKDTIFYIYSVNEFVPILTKLNRKFGGPVGEGALVAQ